MSRGPGKKKPTHRLFIGIPADTVAGSISPGLPDALFSGPFAEKNLKLTRKENWHLTLSFMPAVTEGQTARLIETLATAGFGDTFQMTLKSLGAFPGWERAAVIFAAPAPGDHPRLNVLAKTTRALVRDLGISQDDKPFTPHLTLARCRQPHDLSSMIPPDEANLANPVPLTVRHLTLYESTRTGGELYARLASIALDQKQ